MIICRLITASKSSAQRLYVRGKGKPDKVSNIIDPESFEKYLMPLDTTPQKKYIQAIAKWVVKESLSLVSHYGVNPPLNVVLHPEDNITQDSLQGLVFYGPDAAERGKDFLRASNAFGLKPNSMGLYDLVPAINIFNLAEVKGIKPHDINSFPTAQNFVDYVRKLDEEYKLSEGPQLEAWNKKVEDYFKHHPQPGIKKTETAWILPLTHFELGEALMKPLMGEDSHWCVTRKQDLWDQYVGRDELAYYLIISRKEANTMYMVEAKKGVKGPLAVAVWSWNNHVLTQNDKMSFYGKHNLLDSQFPWFQPKHGWKGKKSARVLIFKYSHYLKPYFESVTDPVVFNHPFSLFENDMRAYMKKTLGVNPDALDEAFEWPEVQLATGNTFRPTHVINEVDHRIDKYLDSFENDPTWELFEIYQVDMLKGWEDHVKSFWKEHLSDLLKRDFFMWSPAGSHFYQFVDPLIDEDLIEHKDSPVLKEFIQDLRAWLEKRGVNLHIDLIDTYDLAPWKISSSMTPVTNPILVAEAGGYVADAYIKDLIAAVVDANDFHLGTKRYMNFHKVVTWFAREWVRKYKREGRKS